MSFAYSNGSVAAVVKASVAGGISRYIYNGSTNSSANHLLGSRSNGENLLFQGSLISSGLLSDSESIWFGNFAATDSLYINGSLVASGNAGTNAWISDTGSVGSYGSWKGKIAEIIFWNDQSSNRVAIETNINNHYNIYA